jgi:hypothetical protein
MWVKMSGVNSVSISSNYFQEMEPELLRETVKYASDSALIAIINQISTNQLEYLKATIADPTKQALIKAAIIKDSSLK